MESPLFDDSGSRVEVSGEPVVAETGGMLILAVGLDCFQMLAMELNVEVCTSAQEEYRPSLVVIIVGNVVCDY